MEIIKKLLKIEPKEKKTSTIQENNFINSGELIKMAEVTKLLHASAPTVRKYARLGFYKEYRFGTKLVFYNKSEILKFIMCEKAE